MARRNTKKAATAPARSRQSGTGQSITRRNGQGTSAANGQPETTQTVRYAELGEVAEFAQDLPEEFLLCREMGHRWLPYNARQNPDGTYFRALRCPRCKTRKEQDVSDRGVILSSAIKYPEGYLHNGMGRIVGDGRGILRLEAIQRTITRVEAKKK